MEIPPNLFEPYGFPFAIRGFEKAWELIPNSSKRVVLNVSKNSVLPQIHLEQKLGHPPASLGTLRYSLLWAEGWSDPTRWIASLETGGIVVLSQLNWWTEHRKKDAQNFWAKYDPLIENVDHSILRFHRGGYEVLEQFPVDFSEWWKPSGAPLDHEGSPALLRETLEIFRRFPGLFGVTFFLLKKTF